MKTFLSTILILLTYTCAITYAGMYSVCSGDGSTVWAVGDAGNIIKSTDGGVGWISFFLGSTRYYSVFSINQNVWIAGDSGRVQISSDNGTNWTQFNLSTASLRSVFFTGVNNGWIAGENGTIFNTTNGGLNWSQQTSPNNSNLYSIRFQNNSEGVACGANGTIITTSNGGASWILLTTPVTKDLLSIDRKSSTIIASGVDQTIIKSTNNGTSWVSIDYKITTKSDINCIFMFDASTYYSIGGGGFIRKSSDGGSNFTFQINPMLADLYNIYFYDNNKGWATGRDNRVVLRTTDGGVTWQLPAGTTQSLVWVRTLFVPYYTSSGNVFALNNFNKNGIFITANPTNGFTTSRVYRSLNFGANWTGISNNIPIGNNTHAFLISPKDSNRFLVEADSIRLDTCCVGNHSRVLRSTDYGVHWDTTFYGDLDPDGATLTYDPNHPDTVYLAPTDSVIFRSTDFGRTWSSTGPTVLGKLCSIRVLPENSNIILCGVEDLPTGHVFRSTDYAATWIAVDSITGAVEIPEITTNPFFPNVAFCTYIGSSGGVHKTTNFGLTWTSLLVNNLAWAIDIAEDDPNVIGMGQYSSQRYISVNGGLNFITTSSSNDPAFAFLIYNRKIILSQCNNGFYKLNINYNVPIGIQPISTNVPEQYFLYQNYPNPFNPVTKIKFDVPPNMRSQTLNLKLMIYDVLGREVTTLLNEELKPGTYEVELDGTNYPSGCIFIILKLEIMLRQEK